jgi:hypothetical protein
VSLRPPSENCARRAANTSESRPKPEPLDADSSHEVLSPTASPRSQQWPFLTVDPTPRPPAPSGFLNLLTPSSTASLLALFHARSAHGVRPPELFSSRAAVRRLQRLCPLDVSSAFQTPRQPAADANAETSRLCQAAAEALRNAPRLQGFAPHESPPLHADCLGLRERVALLGFFPSRVFPPTAMASAFAMPPLMRFPMWTTNRPHRAPSGFYYAVGLACLSRDCRPS